jgi:putative oxidoreductase
MDTSAKSSPFGRLVGTARNALDRAAFVAPLATRIVIGLAFVQTGWGKWHNFPRIVQFFASLGIPLPTASAALVSTLELVGGPLLILGLGTRFFAAALSTSMVVALGTADRQTFLSSWSPASETSPTDVTSFTFLLFLLWLVLAGPGKASLDHLISRLLGGGRREPPGAD